MKRFVTRSRFLRVRCLECGNEQVIFDRASTVVKCTICESVLAEPTGGKARLRAQILQTLDAYLDDLQVP